VGFLMLGLAQLGYLSLDMDEEDFRASLFGEYDAGRREELRAALEPLQGACTIDLSEVTYCDSFFLQELILLKKRLAAGAKITLQAPSAAVKRLLEIVGFDRLFHIVE